MSSIKPRETISNDFGKYDMSKQEAEFCNRLSVFWLKKNGYFHGGWNCGGIIWNKGCDNERSISFTVSIGVESHIQLNYTNTHGWSGEKENMDYRVELTTTTCNYGGKRHWFICPLSKNGQYCGRRVGVLYNIGKWFGCRHCGDICYAAQKQGGLRRYSVVSIPAIEQAEADVKRYHYRGKPTRKYRRLMRLNERFEQGLAMLEGNLYTRRGRPKKVL